MTPEQAALLKKARDSLRAARVLADQERLYDFAVSRAYYSMFYVSDRPCGTAKRNRIVHRATGRPSCVGCRWWITGRQGRALSPYIRPYVEKEKVVIYEEG
jgi:hypothetical protein